MQITTPLAAGASLAATDAFLETVLDFYNGPGYFDSIRLGGGAINWAATRSACNALLPPGQAISNFELGSVWRPKLNQINSIYQTVPLFFGSDLVYWFPMSSVNHVWLDTGRTTPATGAAGESIAGVTDLSGNGFHLEQATAASRPFTEIVNGGLRTRFDGVADRLTSIIPVNYGGSDAITVSAAVNKASDASSTRTIVESAPSSTNNGTYGLFGPRVSGEPGFVFASKGTTDQQSGVTTGYPAPFKGVITGIGNISADTSILRIDGSQVASNTGDQGTGTLTNATLNVGFRSGGFFFFDGSMGNLMALRRVASANDLRIIREIGNRSIP